MTVHDLKQICRYSLLSLAACEAALQLFLPDISNRELSPDAETRQRLQRRRERKPRHKPGPYSDILGEENCCLFGEDVVFVANDWHAGALAHFTFTSEETAFQLNSHADMERAK